VRFDVENLTVGGGGIRADARGYRYAAAPRKALWLRPGLAGGARGRGGDGVGTYANGGPESGSASLPLGVGSGGGNYLDSHRSRGGYAVV